MFVPGEEDVCGLQVSMENFTGVEDVKRSHHLNEDGPNLLLVKALVGLGELDNFLVKVAVVLEIHDQTETLGGILEERLLIADDGVVFYGGENTNLIECILLLLGRKLAHFDLFKRVNGLITLTFNLVDLRVGALT